MIEGHDVTALPVSDGRRIKWTLEQRRVEAADAVHCDWLRFTVPVASVFERECAECPDADYLAGLSFMFRDLVRQCMSADGGGTIGAMAACRGGARQVCEVLEALEVGHVEDRGMDFYTARCALVREGATVGWVLAGGRSETQAGTVHVNLFGSALMWVSPAKVSALADWIEARGGWITRCDLALDLFDGYPMESLPADYLAGAFDVRGKRPSQDQHGAWVCGHSRTFQVGQRATGKLLRVYEKGDEVFGPDADDPWVRWEVEFRNNARIIPLDILRSPGSFFAGAYESCAARFSEVVASVAAVRIPTKTRVADATAHGAASRLVAWVERVAMPSIYRVSAHGGELLDAIADRVSAAAMPQRLKGFSHAELSAAFEKVAAGIAPPSAPLADGAI